MAFSHGSTAAIYIDDSGGTERNFSTYLKDDSLDQSADTAETTAFSDTAKAYIAGLKDRTLKCSGHYDPTAVGYLYGVYGVATQVKIFPAGSASGRLYFDGTAIITSLNISSDVSDANAVEFDAQFITNPTFGTA